MAANEKPSTRNYDLFKAAVAIGLLIIIAILLIQGRATPAEVEPTAVAGALPTFIAPQLGEGGRISLSGINQPGTSIELWSGSSKLGSTTVDTDGAWQLESTLEPGDYQLSARAVDAAGKLVNESPTWSLSVPRPKVEVAMPEIALPTLGEGGSVGLSGTGQPGASVELWSGDVQLGTTTVGADGKWSWDGKIEPGDYQISAHTVDTAGKVLNESPALAVNVPEAEIAMPQIALPKLGEGGKISLTGTGQPGASVELWAGDVKVGTTTVGADATWSWDGSLEPGDYQISARTVDAAGKVLNESLPLAVNVPEPEIAMPTIAAPTLGEAGGVSLTGSGQPGASVELWAGDVKVGTTTVGTDGKWSWDGTLDPGDYQLTARTVDAAGKTLNESAALALTVAAAAPSPPVMAEPQVSAQGTVTLTGTAEPGTTLEIVEDGKVVGTTVVQDDGTWTYVYNALAGAHELAARSQAAPEAASASASVEVPALTSTGGPSGEGQEYIVKRGDTLADLATRFYNNWRLYRLIFDATNARAAKDPTFHTIERPNLIRPGWKLWIPAQ